MIKTLLFDFGDVFINLDKEATMRQLSRAGYHDIPCDLIPWMHDYEKGLVTTEEFLREAMSAFPGMPREELISAWNAIILDFPRHRLDFLRELSEKGTHRLLLLSNTNALHIQKVKKSMGPEDYQNFSSCFQGFYLSHEIHLRKPEPSVFEMILNKHKIRPEETLFVDDTHEHIDSAHRLGFVTWHLQVGKEDITELKKKL
jgi:putative hydrolase of the HAD superfamily